MMIDCELFVGQSKKLIILHLIKCCSIKCFSIKCFSIKGYSISCRSINCQVTLSDTVALHANYFRLPPVKHMVRMIYGASALLPVTANKADSLSKKRRSSEIGLGFPTFQPLYIYVYIFLQNFQKFFLQKT